MEPYILARDGTKSGLMKTYNLKSLEVINSQKPVAPEECKGVSACSRVTLSGIKELFSVAIVRAQ